MKYDITEIKILLAGLNAIDPHNVFATQLKQKIMAQAKADEKEKADK